MRLLNTRLIWLLPLLAGAVAYAIAPWGMLVWDDEFVIRQQLVALRSWSDIVTPPAGIPHWSYSYYRPLTVLSYLVDARLFGLGATTGPHAANVVFHLVTTFFVFLLVRRLLRGRPNGDLGAVLAATLFAVHPIHTESVSWLMGRSDTLATMLLTPALLLALAWRDRRSPVALVLAAALFFLAMLAKEVAIAGVAILPVLLWLAPGLEREPRTTAPRRDWGALAVTALLWVAAAGLYLALRPVAVTDANAWTPSADSLLWQPLRALAWYLLKLVAPWPQTNFVVWELIPAGSATVAVLAAGAGLLAWAFWHWRRSGDGVPLLGLLWTGIALAPSLAATLPGVASTPVAERYLYLPSVGAALGLGAVCAALASRRPRIVVMAAGLLCVLYAAATLQRGFVWLDDLRLWTDTTTRVTGYGLPFIELGRARQAAGDDDGALEAYLRARDLKNSPLNRAVAHFDVGTMQGQRGRIAEAERSFTAAIAADPTYARGHYGLGRIYYERAVNGAPTPSAAQRLALLKQAQSSLDRAIALNPTFVNAHIALGWTLTTQGDVVASLGDRDGARARYQAALDHLDVATALEPATPSRPEAQELRRIATQRLAAR